MSPNVGPVGEGGEQVEDRGDAGGGGRGRRPSVGAIEQAQQLLEQFSLPPSEAKTLVAMMRLGSATAIQLAAVTGIDRTNLYRVLENLQRRELVRRSPERASLWVVAGRKQVLSLLRQREQERSRMAADTLERLDDALQDVPEPEQEATSAIEVVNEATMLLRYDEAITSATTEVLVFNRGPYVGELRVDPSVATAVTGGVRGRALWQAHEVYGSDSLHASTCARAYADLGVETRVNRALPLSMAVIDGSVALLRLPGDGPADLPYVASVVVENAAFGRAMAELFEHLWDQGDALDAPEEKDAAAMHGRCRQDGFTLIELLVVIIILGIISGVVVFAVRGIGSKGHDEAIATDRRVIRTAEEAFCAKHGRYADEAELVEKKFLSDYSELHSVVATEDPPDPRPCNGWRYEITGGGGGTDPGPGPGDPSAKCGQPEGWCEVPGLVGEVFHWTPRAAMVELPSGKVLAVTRDATAYQPHTFIYDPAVGSAGRWIPGPAFATTPPPTAHTRGIAMALLTDNPATTESECASATVDNCGKVLALIGGQTLHYGRWQIYDPDAGPLGSWSDIDSPAGGEPTQRSAHQTYVMPINGTPEQCGANCGNVMIVGFSSNPSTAAVVELYDPRTNRFTITETTFAACGRAVTEIALAQLQDGRILMSGRNNYPTGCGTADRVPTGVPWAKLFNPRTGAFEDAATPNYQHDPRRANGLVVLADRNVLGIGVDEDGDLRAEIYTADSGDGSWTEPDEVPTCANTEKPNCSILGSLSDGTVMATRTADGVARYGSTDILLFGPARTWTQTGSLNSGDAGGEGIHLKDGGCTLHCNKFLVAGQNGASELYSPK